MKTTRLEGFSDGVIAIIVTIMVLDLKAPSEVSQPLITEWLPHLLGYAFSFIAVAIYWVNHHQLLQNVRKTTRTILWANLHWLFWLSLVPFVTAWMGNTRAAPLAVAVYGGLGFITALAYWLLRVAIRHAMPYHATNTRRDRTWRRHEVRNRLALASLALSIPLGLLYAGVGLMLLCVPPLLYFLPERTGIDAAHADDENLP